jgi:hypothetical protein
MGFVIDEEEARALLAKGGDSYFAVVAPFINGDDMVKRKDQDPSRWVIDLADMPLEVASTGYPLAVEVLRERVLPERQHDPAQMKRWWQFWNTRMGIRRAVKDLPRFAICCLTGKRLLLSWAEPNWRPSHACGVFAFSDDFNFGVCSSRIHEVWARANGSTLEDRLRYTPSSVFDTFPFPRPTEAQRERIAVAARRIVELRRSACDSVNAGLTKVYNLVDEGGFVELKAAHRELDVAVADAYGWDAALLDDPKALLEALFDLNARCAGDDSYLPFGAPVGVGNLLDDEVEEDE